MARLTSLANVKRYLTIERASQDTLIDQLIPRESDLVQRYTGRVFPFVDNVGVRLNGTGTRSIVLPDAPILNVSAVSVGAVALTASPDGASPGYSFDESAVYLTGAIFDQGLRNVTASWQAGYATTESGFVPTGNTPTLSPDDAGFAHTDRGVTYANGAALTSTSNAPIAGQYSFADGVYTFNASDASAEVTMAFYYVPAAVEQAVIEMVGLDLKQRDNLGISSKTLAGESLTYEKSGMPASVKEQLAVYRRRVPV